MKDEDNIKLYRIKSIIEASEELIEASKEVRYDKDTIQMAKEVAYNHIKEIVADVSYNPWQE